MKQDQTPPFKFSHTGFKNRVLKEYHLADCNPSKNPSQTVSLGFDRDGVPFSENWEYASITGMLILLAKNYRPDIAYALHQCARFTNLPKTSHGDAVKHTIRYLQGTKDKDIIIYPIKTLQVDCHVDAEFSGLRNMEHEQDLTCVKSCTWFFILFINCPLLWK